MKNKQVLLQQSSLQTKNSQRPPEDKDAAFDIKSSPFESLMKITWEKSFAAWFWKVPHIYFSGEIYLFIFYD